jgi:hypothetical protein
VPGEFSPRPVQNAKNVNSWKEIANFDTYLFGKKTTKYNKTNRLSLQQILAPNLLVE